MTPKKLIQTSPTTHAPFFDEPQIWSTFIYLYHQFFKSSCACSNSWPTKKNLWASTRTHDPFFDNPKIWPTFIYREKCAKNPYFYHFFWKKEVKLEKNKKKTVAGINCRPWPIFPNITHLTHFYIWGVKCSGHIFFLLFLGKTGEITRYLGKKTYGHQLGPMTHFLTTLEFDLLLYIGEKCLQTHLQSFLCMS